MVRIPKPYQVLIADDDVQFRRTLRGVFEPRPSVDTLEVGSGEEAIVVAESTRVDLVLLDMNMELLTGLETLRIIKSMDSSIPCILITADFSNQLARDASDADAFSVLRKPVRKSKLVETVSTALLDAYDDPEIVHELTS